MAEEHLNRHILGEPVRDEFDLSPVEIVEFNEAGLVMRSLESGRLWGVALNRSAGIEEVEVTELESEVDG